MSDLRFPKIQTTLLDRVVGWFNPAAGLERVRARAMLGFVGGGGHKAGKRDRRMTRNWRLKEASANVDTVPDLPDLRARSRDLVRNMPIATGALATTITNVVGDGLVPQPLIDREVLGLGEEAATAWQKAAEREFRLFASTADFTRVQSFQEMQALALRSILESGDIAVLRRYRKDPGDTFGTKLQLVEADRISTPRGSVTDPKIVAGIELDESGVPIAMHIARRPASEKLTTPTEWDKVEFRDADGRQLVLHLFDRQRPDLTRGIPWLAPVIEELHALAKYSEAEVTAAVVSSFLTVFLTQEPPGEGEPQAPIGDQDDASVGDDELELGAGAILRLHNGEKPELVDPTRPNPVFDAFFTAVVRQIGVALELPFELMIKHFTSSYSASRASLEMAWQFFRKRRSWLARRLCQPAYEWAISEAVAAGRLAAPGFFASPIVRQAYLGCEWIGPARINLDPLKESKADSNDIEMGVKTRAQVITERTGGTFERKTEQLGREERERSRLGLNAPAANAADADQSEPPADEQDQEDRRQ